MKVAADLYVFCCNMSITFDQLKEKEVINCRDGRVLGCICDLELDPCSGKITHIVLPPYGSFFVFSKSKNKIVIPWDHIDRIGEDVIIVRYNQPPEKPKNK